MLAEFGRAGPDRTRRAVKPRHHMMHRDLAHLRIRIIGDQLPLDHMRIGHDLRRVVDRTDGDFSLLEEADILLLRPRADEFADDGIEFINVAQPVGIGAEARVVDQSRDGQSPGAAARPFSGSSRTG